VKETRAPRSAVVIGLGTFGGTVALELRRLGFEVLGVDPDEARVSELAERLSDAVVADAREGRALDELGLKGYEIAVVGIGQDLEASILATLKLKDLGLRVWAKANNRNHHRILERLGADRVTHPEQDSALRVAQQLLHPELMDFMSFGDRYYVLEVRAPASLAGRPLRKLDFGKNVAVTAHLRAGTLTSAGQQAFADTMLEAGDCVLVVGRLAELTALAARL